MITKHILRYALTSTIAFCLINAHAQKNRQPNIIVILADDMGYADMGVQGFAADVKTPHLDSLARAGTRFTNGYVTAPQCSPSRAGLLTGRYQQRFGFDEIPTGPLPLEETTLADRLKKAGYRTGMVGKWHLEPNAVTVKWAKKHLPDALLNKEGRLSAIPLDKRLPYMPAARGFDEFFTGELNNYWTNFDVANGTLLDE
ncbi:MAG TPA: sulfatase-like hydrolase/transferase, partial [Candidatus Saccharimonadales bacterium]|nr:sulfatase-like hydrolase/transferase [Candidatus Saccharimonadales bacterium]